MSGSCGVCVDGVLYLFGGHYSRGNTNRVHCVWHVQALCAIPRALTSDLEELVSLTVLCSPLHSADLPSTTESSQSHLGGNAGPQRTPSILKRQARVLGSEEQVKGQEDNNFS